MGKVREVLRRNPLLASITALFVVGVVVSTAASGSFSPSLASSSSPNCQVGYGCPPPPSTTTTTSTTATVTITATNRSGPGDVVVSGTTTPDTNVALYDQWFGRTTFRFKATTLSDSTGAYSFTVHIANTNHFYVVAGGVQSSVVAAVVTPVVTRVYVTPPALQGPGTVAVRVTTNQPGAVIHLFDQYAGAQGFVQKAVHVAELTTVGNGVWTFQVANVRATNHFYAVVNGVRSNTATAPIT